MATITLSSLLQLGGTSGQIGQRYKEFKTVGIYQFTVPSDCHIIYVTGCGGGQGGTISNLNAANTYPPKRGGNGAFSVIDLPLVVIPNSVITVSIPSGGVANMDSGRADGGDLLVNNLTVHGGRDLMTVTKKYITKITTPAANASYLKYSPNAPSAYMHIPSDNLTGVVASDSKITSTIGNKFTTFYPADIWNYSGASGIIAASGMELEDKLLVSLDGKYYRGGFGGLNGINGVNTNIDGEYILNRAGGAGGGGATPATSGGGGGASLFGDGGNYGMSPSSGNYGSGGGGGSIFNNGTAGNGAQGFCILRY